MTLPAKKHLILLFLLMLLIGFCANFILRLYDSRDVQILKHSYPSIEKSRVTFSLKKPKRWVGLNEISENAKLAVVLTEDWSFYQHDGVDYSELFTAIREIGSKRLRGASTITQQLVKNVFLTEERTISRKFHELILTVKVEKTLTKDRILEVYLNSIEYGPGIIGIKRASQHYFKKAPSELSAREGAFIAMMLPSPIRYYVSFREKRLTDFARKRIQEILEKMRVAQVITLDEYNREVASTFSWETR